jgi:hypothetical protein
MQRTTGSMRALEMGEVEEGVLEEDLPGSCRAEQVDDRRRPAASSFMEKTVQVRMETTVGQTKRIREEWKRTSGSPEVCEHG